MKFSEIIKDKEYRERIIKYFRLPIRLSVSEEKFLSDLDFIKRVQPKEYKRLVTFVEHDFNKEAREQGVEKPDFTMEHMLNPIVEDFEASPRWQVFLEKDYSNVLKDFDGAKNVHQFYKKENDGKRFVSLDLEAANWQSLQNIIGFEESYEDFIKKHTDNLIPPISKSVRTKITGLLGARNIMYYNAQLLKENKSALLESLYKHTGVDLRKQEPFAFYADEFLIEVDEETEEKLNNIDFDKVEDALYKDTNIKVHLTPFRLKWLEIDKSCAKLYRNNEYEILNISKDKLLIIHKIVNGIKVNDIDYEKIKLKKQTREEFEKELSDIIEVLSKEK